MDSLGVFHKRFLILIVIMFCLHEIIFAQTFHFSKGWTNGKKRSSMDSYFWGSKGFKKGTDRPETLGLCQIQKLREIWENNHLDQKYLPCKMTGKLEAGFAQRREAVMKEILF